MKYIDAAEAAKMIRNDLKKHFSGIKFSVRRSSSHIDVKWIDGPTEQNVQAILNCYEGKTFDSSDDMYHYHTTEIDGEEIQVQASITCQRELSRLFLETIMKQYCKENGLPLFEVKGGEQDGWINWDFTNQEARSHAHYLSQLLNETDAKDMHRAYEAREEAESEEAHQEKIQSHEEPQFKPLPVQKPVPTCCTCGCYFFEDDLNGDGECEECANAPTILEPVTEQQVIATPVEDVSEEVIEETPGKEDASEQVSDPRSNPDASIVYRFDPISRIHWLEFDGKPEQEVINLLKREGWRWSSYRKQWHTNRRWAQVPNGIDYYNDGECDYSAERAERLEARSEKKYDKFQEHRAKSDAISGMIPLGQPIMVGHHSEGRHRRDLNRIWENERKAWGNYNYAKDLQERAESSQRHQQYLESPDVIARRLERLETELRSFQRNKEGWKNDLAEYERRVAILERELAENKAKLEEAGGLEIDQISLQKGDLILLHGHIVEVIRVNKKTITGYLTAPHQNLWDGPGRTKRCETKSDRTTFGLRIYTVQEWEAIKAGKTQAEAYEIAQAHFKTLQ